ncbi:MAG: DNA-directed RNA polymerase subunit omega [Saprospiraceae bacterium]|jgi:DNA-directed RNA polymerase subunit K/omega|nr:DNA-directed RNA polymerase subunit omega [Saprospiraceae bacterium]MBK6817116.1 DNA-directed RNA polymerase subunit omega [Saprospiraceae bacterium]MBK7371670.1 DNA-directed RNA polymerase subunit omega [Saprospiraceae bacterium]MBK7435857.1 DNA-directed RNA polymerase subunit omega [Saprospiraceae bacterium]MBK7606508.1 DNA-directed RNA polymerase subunit omega [Saprospiraceae bacterium]
MSDIKNKVQGVDPNVRARDIKAMAEKTGNLYETISIISKRANQLNMEIKKELHFKLEEFAVSSDTIEEVHENKEQIEISKFYEKLPNSAILATEEFLEGALNYRYADLPSREDIAGLAEGSYKE